MFEKIKDNLDKFEYVYHCECNKKYVYKSITILYKPHFFFGYDVSLYIDNKYIYLNKKESKKLKKIYVELDNLRVKKYKEQISRIICY